jgi:hypothetical protein
LAMRRYAQAQGSEQAGEAPVARPKLIGPGSGPPSLNHRARRDMAMTKTAAELIPIADPGVSTDGEPTRLAGAWTGAVLADIGPGN